MHVCGVVKAWTPLFSLQPNGQIRFVSLETDSHVCHLMITFVFAFEMNQVVSAHGRMHKISSRGLGSKEKYVLLVDTIEAVQYSEQANMALSSLLYEHVQECKLVSYCGIIKNCIQIDKHWKVYQIDGVWVISANELDGSKVVLHNLHVLLGDARSWLGIETRFVFVSCFYNSCPSLEVKGRRRVCLPDLKRFFVRQSIKITRFIKEGMISGSDERSEAFLRRLQRIIFGSRVRMERCIKYTDLFEHQQECRLVTHFESTLKSTPPRFLTVSRLKEIAGQLGELQLMEREKDTLLLVYVHQGRVMDDTGSMRMVVLGEQCMKGQVALIMDWSLCLSIDTPLLIVKQYKTVLLTRTSKSMDTIDEHDGAVYEVLWRDEEGAYLFDSNRIYQIETSSMVTEGVALIPGSVIRLHNVIMADAFTIKFTETSRVVMMCVESFDKYMLKVPRVSIDKVTSTSPFALVSFGKEGVVQMRLITTCSICEQPLAFGRCPKHNECKTVSFAGYLLCSVTFGKRSFLVETNAMCWIRMLFPGMNGWREDTFIYEHPYLTPVQTSIIPDQEWGDRGTVEGWTALVKWMADDETRANSFMRERLLGQKRVRILHLRKYDAFFDACEGEVRL
jgi:hypothetical protein